MMHPVPRLLVSQGGGAYTMHPIPKLLVSQRGGANMMHPVPQLLVSRGGGGGGANMMQPVPRLLVSQGGGANMMHPVPKLLSRYSNTILGLFHLKVLGKEQKIFKRVGEGSSMKICTPPPPPFRILIFGKISVWANCGAISELKQGKHSLELVRFLSKIYRNKKFLAYSRIRLLSNMFPLPRYHHTHNLIPPSPKFCLFKV